jgi:hypothetical protein
MISLFQILTFTSYSVKQREEIFSIYIWSAHASKHIAVALRVTMRRPLAKLVGTQDK